MAWLSKMPDIKIPYNLQVMSGQILIGISLIGYLVVTRTNPFRLVQHKRLGIIDILLVIALMFLSMPLIYFINYISMFFTENEIAGTLGGMTDNLYIVNLMMLALSPAIFEEMICRGVMFHAYRRKSFTAAVLLSALIFGLLHMNLNQMLYAAAIGIIFAVTVEVTESIYSSMIMHFIMNGISVTALAFLKFMRNLGLYTDDMLAQQEQMSVDMFAEGVPVIATVILICIAVIIVACSTALAAGIIYLLAKRHNRVNVLKKLFKGGPAEEETETGTVMEYKNAYADAENDKDCRIIGAPLVIAVIICLAVMIFL